MLITKCFPFALWFTLITTSLQLQNNERQLKISNYNFLNNGSGIYQFGVETSDGTRRDEEGTIVDENSEDEALIVNGQYMYVGDDGQIYIVKYRADDNGFHPEGKHLKVPPYVPWLKGQPHDDGQYRDRPQQDHSNPLIFPSSFPGSDNKVPVSDFVNQINNPIGSSPGGSRGGLPLSPTLPGRNTIPTLPFSSNVPSSVTTSKPPFNNGFGPTGPGDIGSQTPNFPASLFPPNNINTQRKTFNFPKPSLPTPGSGVQISNVPPSQQSTLPPLTPRTVSFTPIQKNPVISSKTNLPGSVSPPRNQPQFPPLTIENGRSPNLPVNSNFKQSTPSLTNNSPLTPQGVPVSGPEFNRVAGPNFKFKLHLSKVNTPPLGLPTLSPVTPSYTAVSSFTPSFGDVSTPKSVFSLPQTNNFRTVDTTPNISSFKPNAIPQKSPLSSTSTVPKQNDNIFNKNKNPQSPPTLSAPQKPVELIKSKQPQQLVPQSGAGNPNPQIVFKLHTSSPTPVLSNLPVGLGNISPINRSPVAPVSPVVKSRTNVSSLQPLRPDNTNVPNLFNNNLPKPTNEPIVSFIKNEPPATKLLESTKPVRPLPQSDGITAKSPPGSTISSHTPINQQKPKDTQFSFKLLTGNPGITKAGPFVESGSSKPIFKTNQQPHLKQLNASVDIRLSSPKLQPFDVNSKRPTGSGLLNQNPFLQTSQERPQKTIISLGPKTDTPLIKQERPLGKTESNNPVIPSVDKPSKTPLGPFQSTSKTFSKEKQQNPLGPTFSYKLVTDKPLSRQPSPLVETSTLKPFIPNVSTTLRPPQGIFSPQGDQQEIKPLTENPLIKQGSPLVIIGNNKPFVPSLDASSKTPLGPFQSTPKTFPEVNQQNPVGPTFSYKLVTDKSLSRQPSPLVETGTVKPFIPAVSNTLKPFQKPILTQRDQQESKPPTQNPLIKQETPIEVEIGSKKPVIFSLDVSSKTPSVPFSRNPKTFSVVNQQNPVGSTFSYKLVTNKPLSRQPSPLVETGTVKPFIPAVSNTLKPFQKPVLSQRIHQEIVISPRKPFNTPKENETPISSVHLVTTTSNPPLESVVSNFKPITGSSQKEVTKPTFSYKLVTDKPILPQSKTPLVGTRTSGPSVQPTNIAFKSPQQSLFSNYPEISPKIQQHIQSNPQKGTVVPKSPISSVGITPKYSSVPVVTTYKPISFKLLTETPLLNQTNPQLASRTLKPLSPFVSVTTKPPSGSLVPSFQPISKTNQQDTEIPHVKQPNPSVETPKSFIQLEGVAPKGHLGSVISSDRPISVKSQQKPENPTFSYKLLSQKPVKNHEQPLVDIGTSKPLLPSITSTSKSPSGSLVPNNIPISQRNQQEIEIDQLKHLTPPPESELGITSKPPSGIIVENNRPLSVPTQKGGRPVITFKLSTLNPLLNQDRPLVKTRPIKDNISPPTIASKPPLKSVVDTSRPISEIAEEVPKHQLKQTKPETETGSPISPEINIPEVHPISVTVKSPQGSIEPIYGRYREGKAKIPQLKEGIPLTEGEPLKSTVPSVSDYKPISVTNQQEAKKPIFSYKLSTLNPILNKTLLDSETLKPHIPSISITTKAPPSKPISEIDQKEIKKPVFRPIVPFESITPIVQRNQQETEIPQSKPPSAPQTEAKIPESPIHQVGSISKPPLNSANPSYKPISETNQQDTKKPIIPFELPNQKPSSGINIIPISNDFEKPQGLNENTTPKSISSYPKSEVKIHSQNPFDKNKEINLPAKINGPVSGIIIGSVSPSNLPEVYSTPFIGYSVLNIAKPELGINVGVVSNSPKNIPTVSLPNSISSGPESNTKIDHPSSSLKPPPSGFTLSHETVTNPKHTTPNPFSFSTTVSPYYLPSRATT